MAGVAVAMETALEATARRDTVGAWRFRDSNGSDSAQVHAPGACWPCPSCPARDLRGQLDVP